jgi:hypothetical protein
LQPSAIQSSFGDISQLIWVLGGFKTAVNKHIWENEWRWWWVSKISHEFDEPIYEIDEVISRLREKLNWED